MIINNTEALKSWLVIVLAPLCDADSSALARYVLALLKKDKPEDVLKCVMIEQLDVFLGEETTPFVERLFNAISTEEYLTIQQQPTPSTQPTPTTTTTATTTTTLSSSPAVKIENEFDIEDNLSAEAISLAKGDAIRNASKNDESNMPFDEKLKHSIKDECTTKEVVNLNQKVVGSDVSAASNLCKLSNSTSTTVISDGGCVMNTQRHISPLRGHITASDKENQPRESRRRRPSQQSRSRTRSRSLERYTRRSRSPRDRRGNQRQFRNNKSPPSSNCHDRRRGAAFNRSERQRSSAANNNASSNNSNHVESTRKMRSNNPHGTSSSSPDRSRSTSTAIAPSGTEADVTKMEKRQRCRDFDEKGYCVRGETCPWDHGINPVVFEGINNPALISMSLREYNPDAPDLWSRSSPAAGLSSSTGMVVGSTATSNINPFTGTPRVNPLAGAGAAGIVYPTHVGVGVGAGLPIDKAAGGAAAPLAYRSTGPPLIQYPFNAVSPMQQRELIPIPVVDAEIGNMSSMKAAMGPESNSIGGHPPANKRRFDLMEEHNVNVATDALPPKRKLAVNSRLGPRLPANIQSNCSLELRKVPRGLNTIAHLNNHFAKFGKIVNIQISYEGDPEAAIITFSTHAEANVAYRSTEAVLNNRFIKVFWHTEVAATGETNANAVVNGARKNNHHYHLNNMTANANANANSANTVSTNELTANKATTSSSELSNKDNTANSSGSGVTNANNELAVPATTAAAAAVTATHVPATSLRLKNNIGRPSASNAGMRKKQEEQVKAVVQLANGLRKRKQELLQSYVKQMKSALELVERCDPQDAQRAKTLETIKILQETIDKLRKEIAAEQEQVQAQMTSNQKTAGNLITKNSTPPAKKSKEQQKKELLDIELELFAQQQEGNDTTAIQKRLEELQRNLGIGGTAAPQISAGAKLGTFSSNPRKNPRAMRTMVFPEGPTRVDRRPKTIVITGFVADEADFVLGHFKNFGEILKHDVDREIPQLILSYATRMSAEQAVVRGKIFKGNKLQISWAPVISNLTNPNERKPSMEKLAQDIKIEKEELETVGEENNKLTAAIEDVTELGCTNEKKNLLLSEKLISDNTLLPELRLEDEEEEEESEDRSWRR